MNKNITFLGAGSAAEAILSGIIKAGIVERNRIRMTNRNNIKRREYLEEQYQITCCENKEKAVREADIIILAMKPYDLQESLSEIKSYINKQQLLISILAGVSTETIIRELNVSLPVIRAMPNTSAMVGYSATALTKGRHADREHMELAEELFDTIGTTTIVDENDMHIVTAISGSGPAYIYYMVEAMESAAIEAGLDQKVAKELITHTVIGAGEMLQKTGERADILRKKITSPHGTTEAGISVLEKNHFQKIMMDCVKNAQQRSEELGKG
ncbi:pyrroline-5-carboxylate reductase [Oceanobacillus halophilus]|uniref:Pyrroline-5-carboxylate reductase n=1 Tax=Oceanobacillus halophilus TaxID=930130 RepID=A0A495A401_9BACI|nr:pyrroline-5-carboxylate reductase [Oceanobacillus halophilus]RKQ32990.1 pyrroline-5-carboxylate reductase [Oceanobacillus halophilus]